MRRNKRARAKPVVDHLQNGASHALGIEREQAKHHKSEVADGGIRHQFFDIRLGVGNRRAVDDADGRQQRNPRGGLDSRFGEERNVEAQETVGSHLQQDARKDDRTRSRRFDVGIGQPRVQGPHRDFDRKGGGEGNEEPHLDIRGNAALGNQLGHREGVALNAKPDDGKQHQNGTSHRVEEELDGGIDAARSAPDADQEVHRHEGEFPEDVEQEQVLREEDAHHADFQQQEEDHEILDAVFDGCPRGEDGDGREEVPSAGRAGCSSHPPRDSIGCSSPRLESRSIWLPVAGRDSMR